MILRSLSGLLVCCVLVGGARADEQSDQDARRLFQEGRDAFEKHAYQKAYDAFRQAYLSSQRPELLFNMSSALKELGRPHDAAEELRAYLRVVPTAPDRPQIEQRILTLEETQRILDRDRREATPAPTPTAPAPTAAPAPTPTARVQTVAPAPTAELTQPPPAAPTVESKKHGRWWLWATVAGVAAVGLTVGLTVGLVPNNAAPPPTQGGSMRALFQ